MSGKILIVDDEKFIRLTLSQALSTEGHHVDTAADAESAIMKMKAEAMPYNIVITDLKMGAMAGTDLLIWIKKRFPSTDVIVITAFGTVNSAVEAMKSGAVDYLPKPVEIVRLRNMIRQILEKQRLLAENVALKQQLGRPIFNPVVGISPAIQEVYETIERVARTDATVLIEGESGTGKEIIATTIHRMSERRKNPFVVVNCAALPASLLENELFGHEREAFTGAASLKKGRFEQAHGGTIFLDEITEMSLESQSRFLRVLEDGCFHRVGGSESIRVDVRIISASNRGVADACQSGRFRFDLYYRLNVVPIHVPPLRERKEDIPIFIDYFLKEFATKYERPDLEIKPQTVKELTYYPWPGNIRELRNAVERAVILCRKPPLAMEHFRELKRGNGRITPTGDIPVGITLKEMEQKMIQKALDQVEGHRKKAAEMLGISVRTLQYKIKEYDLTI